MSATMSRSISRVACGLSSFMSESMKKNIAAGLGAPQQVLRHLVEVLQRLGGGDHELHRQALRPGQRRELERRHLRAGDVIPALLQHLLQLIRGARALAPGLEQHAAEACVHRALAHVLEHAVVLGQRRSVLEHLLAVGLHLLVGRIRRALDLRHHHALVLARRQFRIGRGEQVDRQAQHAGAQDHQHLPGPQPFGRAAAGRTAAPGRNCGPGVSRTGPLPDWRGTVSSTASARGSAR